MRREPLRLKDLKDNRRRSRPAHIHNGSIIGASLAATLLRHDMGLCHCSTTGMHAVPCCYVCGQMHLSVLCVKMQAQLPIAGRQFYQHS